MEEIIIRKNENVEANFKKCVELLLNYKILRKSNSYAFDLIKSLANWQLSQIDSDEIKIVIEQKNRNILAFSRDGTIFISTEALKTKRLKDFVKLTDILLHEFSHIKTDKQNAKIRKNEHGTANNQYKPKYFYYGVLELLKKFIDAETAGDLALAYYSKNENEQTANIQAKDEILKLISSAKQIKNYAWLGKMETLENDQFDKTLKNISQHNNKLSIYDQLLKTNLAQFQLNYASNPKSETDKDEQNKLLFFVSRTLNPCGEADQMLFKHYLAKKDVENCLMLINLPDFKHNISNLRDLIALLKEKNVSLSKITNVDLSKVMKEQKSTKPFGSVCGDDKVDLTL